jgi:hypothetical protein
MLVTPDEGIVTFVVDVGTNGQLQFAVLDHAELTNPVQIPDAFTVTRTATLVSIAQAPDDTALLNHVV